jgi:predicted transcriptional regulator
MAMTKCERVKRMKKSFMRDRELGKPIAKIAMENGVSVMTVYNYLQEIADENGIGDRKELLYHVHKPHDVQKGRMYNNREEIDPKELAREFEDLDNKFEEILNKINEVLQDAQEE